MCPAIGCIHKYILLLSTGIVVKLKNKEVCNFLFLERYIGLVLTQKKIGLCIEYELKRAKLHYNLELEKTSVDHETRYTSDYFVRQLLCVKALLLYST